MPVVEDLFTAGDSNWQSCPECKVAAARLSLLVGKYPVLKKHLEDVFDTRKVRVVFEDNAHFTAADNKLTVPHTGRAEQADDLVDAIIFESYNATRKDQFLLDFGPDFVQKGALTAQIEADTMTDFYQLAMAMEEGDRTANMKKSILRAQGAKGAVSLHFLGSPHEADPDKRALLPITDERRLPTGVMYIYMNIVNAGPLAIRQALFAKANVPFSTVQVKKFGVMGSDIVLTGTPGALQTAATELDTLVKKNWPPTSGIAKRPGVLLEIIDKVQTDGTFAPLKASITQVAFGYTSDMTNLAGLNNLNFQWKA